MRRCAYFNTNQATGQRAENLMTSDRRSRLLSTAISLNIDAMNLENLLRQIETDRANLHGVRFLPSVGDSTHHSGTQMPLRGRPPIRSAPHPNPLPRDEGFPPGKL